MRELLASILTLSLLAVAVPALAQQKPEGQEPGAAKKSRRARFQEMDTNKDGKVSREEWKRRPRAFDRLDANYDGYITRQEMQAARKKARKRR